jgi:type IV pilus assembly protein PilA
MVELGLVSGGTSKTGRYVQAVDVATGTITITYGKDANLAINGGHLSFRPLQNVNEDVVWVCGNADDPSGTTDTPTGGTASGANQTDITDKYLPSSCRTNYGGA